MRTIMIWVANGLMLLTMLSRWCAWCGKPVTVGVVVASVVVYHGWERRACLTSWPGAYPSASRERTE
jgi:hypothetical protein